MAEIIPNGTRREIGGRPSVYYDGYWIKLYVPPEDTLTAKKQLIEALTRRLFNHVEHGINIPGRRLEEARRSYEAETDPERRRVKGAMLAGALFNRAADIFTKLVELQGLGVAIATDNALMRECGQCLLEALEFGKTVRHRSGEEGIDELWGEPFKAFTMPVEAFYDSRYIKIAQTMRDIDRVAAAMTGAFAGCPLFPGIDVQIREFVEAAKRKGETLRTDPEIFDIWSAFVVAGERLSGFEPQLPVPLSKALLREAEDGVQLIRAGKELVSHITRARVPMPTSTAAYLERCERYRASRVDSCRAA